MRIVLRVLVFFVSLAAPFAAAAADASVPWMTQAPSHRWYKKALELDGAVVLALSPGAQRRAELLLDQAGPVMAMSPADFASLCPDQVAPKGLTPYLVRAVALDTPQGFVRALRQGNEIAVTYVGPLVQTAVLKKPILLLLPKPPAKLYVTTVLHR
jgi:hypothetical protein